MRKHFILGNPKVNSPLGLSTSSGDLVSDFVSDDTRILADPLYRTSETAIHDFRKSLTFELAGPRKYNYFSPEKVTAAVVTCGGLCPGLNAVIRSLVLTLWQRYGVRKITGIPYGYLGLSSNSPAQPIELKPETVDEIHYLGGTILGTSRGEQSIEEIAEFLKSNRINMLFTIGGDGTLRGALEIYRFCKKNKLEIAIVGIPKTVDNDIALIDASFGFQTAVAEAAKVIKSADVEAKSVYNGIGLVKVMGRLSGFIAAQATIASGTVDFTMIPEVPFELEGGNGFLFHLKNRIINNHHAVVIVAEGAGQNLISESDSSQKDPSGNIVLQDIGFFFKQKITEYFQRQKIPMIMRYFDPSYYIRSVPPSTDDMLLCSRLAQNAVHAAMAGKTGIISGHCNNRYVYIPMELAVSTRKQINPEEREWLSVIETTGQPFLMINKKISSR